MKILSCILAAVFACLGALHVYWALGGKRWLGAGVPQQPDGSPLFKPGAFACFVVAVGLSFFGLVCLVHGYVVSGFGFERFSRPILLVIATIFLLRAIGDFKYAGLSRKKADTHFARLDRMIYTPLCAALCAGLVVLALGSR